MIGSALLVQSSTLSYLLLFVLNLELNFHYLLSIVLDQEEEKCSAIACSSGMCSSRMTGNILKVKYRHEKSCAEIYIVKEAL